MATVILAPGRDRAARRRHPWVMSGAVARVDGAAAAGDLVSVMSPDGEILGYGHFSPGSQIRVRLLAFGKDEAGEALIGERVTAALRLREALPGLAGTDAVRLVNAEGDGLPGLVVDRYADVLVVRPSTAGMLRRADAVAEALRAAVPARAALLRPDTVSLRQENVPARERVLFGEAPAGAVRIDEHGRSYRVDPLRGQKTGFYLDQRDARDLVQSLARGRRVLDAFAYTGGFAVAALQGGAAHATLVESSKDALALAGENVAFARERVEVVADDAFHFLRGAGPAFDLLVIDPPPLARRKGDVQRAARAYKDVLMHALRRAAPEAHLLAFACSHHVGPELFQQIAFGASLDAGRSLRVLGHLEAPADHPVALDHPEGRYLTGLWLQAVA
jgi:23S rRNA (cytosine1962-C5)-methyltransferase